MTICICGGGSLGLVCAGVFASQGVKVNILTGHPENWNNEVLVEDLNGRCYKGALNLVSGSAEAAVGNADVVLLCVPGYLIEKTLIDVRQYLKPEALVGSIVASTGFFFEAHKVLPAQTPLFGFQRVPYIARSKEYGRLGQLLGYKPQLNAAVENVENPEAVRRTLERLFMTPVRLLENYYEASLTNSNPILHTGRLYSMWGKGFVPQPQCTLFYADWTDDASEYLIAMDSEFQALLKVMGIREGVIPPLLEYYESHDAASLTRKISSIPAFKSILAPMRQTDAGWVPDFGSRYFTEDFPFGLSYIRELAHRHSVPCPTIDLVYAWGESVMVRG
ncbi:MAG: NAD/NADP octopine/nopaline dehydrogenase family protein [Muribaculaceae bacterium]|nr:NAD/NADP octopine/nopaline dehydrogenase family protein [Muribaculaceae bacterium]